MPPTETRARLVESFYPCLAAHGIVRATVNFEPDLDVLVHQDLSPDWFFRAFVRHDQVAMVSSIVLEFPPLVWGGVRVPGEHAAAGMARVTVHFAKAIWGCVQQLFANLANLSYGWSGFDIVCPLRQTAPGVSEVRAAITEALQRERLLPGSIVQASCCCRGDAAAAAVLTVINFLDEGWPPGAPGVPGLPGLPGLLAVPAVPAALALPDALQDDYLESRLSLLTITGLQEEPDIRACDVPVIVDFFRRPADASPYESRAVTMLLRPHAPTDALAGTKKVYVMGFSPPLVIQTDVERDALASTRATFGLYVDIRPASASTGLPSLRAFARMTQGLRLHLNLRGVMANHRSPAWTPGGVMVHESALNRRATWVLRYVRVRPAAKLLHAMQNSGAATLAYRRSETLRAYLRLLALNTRARASQIKRAFKRAIADPNYDMCRKRLLKEYRELASV